MQDMQREKAGIRRGGNEYNQKGEFVHMAVGFGSAFSTPYPMRQKQAATGFDPLFHSFHTPYY